MAEKKGEQRGYCCDSRRARALDIPGEIVVVGHLVRFGEFAEGLALYDAAQSQG